MKNLIFLILISACIISLSSCEKTAGEGGTSTIIGKVLIKKYDNTYSLLLSEYYAPKEDVYIIYGTDNELYDDDFETSYDGSYEFKFLQKGTYKIFAYTTDTTGVAQNGTVDENRPKIPVSYTVEVTKKKQTITVPDLVIIKHK